MKLGGSGFRKAFRKVGKVAAVAAATYFTAGAYGVGAGVFTAGAGSRITGLGGRRERMASNAAMIVGGSIVAAPYVTAGGFGTVVKTATPLLPLFLSRGGSVPGQAEAIYGTPGFNPSGGGIPGYIGTPDYAFADGGGGFISQTNPDLAQPTPAPQSKMLLWIGGGLVFFLLLFLLIRR